MVDTGDLKSPDLNSRAGSSPALGTFFCTIFLYYMPKSFFSKLVVANRSTTIKIIGLFFLVLIVSTALFIVLRSGSRSAPRNDTYIQRNFVVGIHTPLDTHFPWYSYTRKIRSLFDSHFMGIHIDTDWPISIQDTFDITGDGIPEALVSLGTNQSYIAHHTIIQVDQTRAVRPAVFTYKNGQTGHILFLDGASATDGMQIIASSSIQSIISAHWNVNAFDPQKIECEFDAYTWNASSSMFVFNTLLSGIADHETCQTIISR